MNLTRPTRLRQACAAFGLAMALGLLAAPQAARAGDDNSSSEFYKATFGRLLEGFGFRSADDTSSSIDYHERAPLVIPPNSNLPPPENASAVANPAWPKDPDVARRRQIEKLEKSRNIEEERQREENPLPPDQLAPGPRPRGTVNKDVEGPSELGALLKPSELGYKTGQVIKNMFHGKNESVAGFTGEPPRASLTDPPPGYQTPSPNQPYGTGQAPAPKPVDDYQHRVEPVR
jgi:hypothetical protein